MTPPPADPIRPITGVADETFITANPIDRVHRREHRDDQGDEGRRRRREQQEEPGDEPAVIWVEEDPALVPPVAYDDHGRLAGPTPPKAPLPATARHFDARA